MAAGVGEDVTVVTANFDAIAAILNGNLDNTNINAAAAIALAKLASNGQIGASGISLPGGANLTLLTEGGIIRLSQATAESDFIAKNYPMVQVASGAAATTIANFGTGYYSGLVLVRYTKSTDGSNTGSALLWINMDYWATVVTTITSTNYSSPGAAPVFSGIGGALNAKQLQVTPGAAGFTGKFFPVFFGFGY